MVGIAIAIGEIVSVCCQDGGLIASLVAQRSTFVIGVTGLTVRLTKWPRSRHRDHARVAWLATFGIVQALDERAMIGCRHCGNEGPIRGVTHLLGDAADDDFLRERSFRSWLCVVAQ